MVSGYTGDTEYAGGGTGMTDKPEIKKENVETLLETRFIKVFDLQYAPGKHYYDATRRELEDIIAIKSDEEFKSMLPDAVTCFLILCSEKNGPRLYMQYEYRYPTGQFLLSPPAGLIDPEDRERPDALKVTAIREIFEETGVTVKDTDSIFEVSPMVFSSPGFTDECNALICAVVYSEDEKELSQKGAQGSERFEGYELLSVDDARRVLSEGRDANGNFYSVYTWAALIYFVSGMWKEDEQKR